MQVGELGTTLTEFAAGYLLTTATDGRVKAVSAAPDLVAGTLVVEAPGRGSVANAAANARVTLLWPPRQVGGMSLIVDGEAEVAGQDVVVRPTGAVLHKPVR